MCIPVLDECSGMNIGALTALPDPEQIAVRTVLAQRHGVPITQVQHVIHVNTRTINAQSS